MGDQQIRFYVRIYAVDKIVQATLVTMLISTAFLNLRKAFDSLDHCNKYPVTTSPTIGGRW